MSISEIVIIGAGVRGTAALGRIAARLSGRPTTPVVVHVVDEFPPGSGRIWREDQPRSLVMNTVPAQSTVFSDDTLGFTHGSPGPSFAEWCERVADGRIPCDNAWVRDAARETLPWSYPSRALYGAYLRWAYAEFARALPAGARLVEHRARATAVRRTADGRFTISLVPPASSAGIAEPRASPATGGGYAIEVDAALFALGWLPRHPGDGIDVPPENPIDQRIERLQPGETVAVRGVGMGFTDLLGLVTEERGGRYAPRPEASRPGQLDYASSGREPVLVAGSRSALPFLAKPEFGAVPPAADLTSLRAAASRLLADRPLDFGLDVLPLIERDAAAEYHRALAELRPGAYHETPEELLAEFAETAFLTTEDDIAGAAARRERTEHWRVLERSLVPDPELRFDPWRAAAPFVGTTAEAVDAEIACRLDRDAAEAALGMRSAWKRGLHVFQSARAAIIPFTDFGGITHESAAELGRFLMVAGLVGSGPPLFRVEQLLAARRAGIVRFAGPRTSVETIDGRRCLVTAEGSAIPVDRVFDARLDLPDPTRHHDLLLASLLESGAARLWSGASATAPPTLEIAPADSALIGGDGTPTAGLHSVGPLHEELRRFTIIAPIPGVASTVLREIDAAVAAVLDHAAARCRWSEPERCSADTIPAGAFPTDVFPTDAFPTDRDEPAHAQ